MPNQSTVSAADLNRVFKALADPTRRTVVHRLAQGPAAVKELAASFDMALPSFMQHLDVLEESGLVASEKSGRTRTYRLSPKPMREVEDWMIAQRAIWDRRLNQLDTYLDKLHKSRQASKDSPESSTSPTRD
jgi:DNA-binding transcriptional ArsR family regulator